MNGYQWECITKRLKNWKLVNTVQWKASISSTWAWESHVTANGRWLHIPSLTRAAYLALLSVGLIGITGCGFDGQRQGRDMYM